MIDLYTWGTPNGQKASIMLEEVDLTYRVVAVDISKGEQHDPEFRKISPNGKIPAIVDHDAVSAAGEPRRIFESGNILVYLAEKAGKLLPESGQERSEVLGWLFFQIGHLGPMVGQWHWFKNAAPVESELSIKRYREESLRLLEVLNGRLGDVPYLGGEGYSIADTANYPWAKAAFDELEKEESGAIASLKPMEDWLNCVGARSAVRKGMSIPSNAQKNASAERKAQPGKGPAGGGTVLP